MKEIDLKSIIIKNGCTQVEFSIKADVGLATINRICNDADYNPCLRIKNKIRNALIGLDFITESDWEIVA
jgi:DNA-binding XRE family transcriptional regulator